MSLYDEDRTDTESQVRECYSHLPVDLTPEENIRDLASRIDPHQAGLHASLGNKYTEAAFVGRRFLIVRTNGRSKTGPKPPTVLGSVEIDDFNCSSTTGSAMRIRNLECGASITVGYVPIRLFEFPIFVSVPIAQGVKSEARRKWNGQTSRKLVWGICLKQHSLPKFSNPGSVSIVTPKEYKNIFGSEAPRRDEGSR
jgi:hypothetical protein